MKLRPLHDRVIVERLEEEKKSAGGIIIPDQAAEKPMKGKVVAVGPGKRTDDGKRTVLGGHDLRTYSMTAYRSDHSPQRGTIARSVDGREGLPIAFELRPRCLGGRHSLTNICPLDRIDTLHGRSNRAGRIQQ